MCGFREAVKDWWKVHVLVDQKIDELSIGYYRLKRCEVKKLLNDVKAVCGNSTVQEMWDNSIARDLSSGVIRVSAETQLNAIAHENKELEKNENRISDK